MRRAFLSAALIAFCIGCTQLPAQTELDKKFVTTSDGVRIHVMDSGKGQAGTLVFIPGWTVPAEIWRPQIEYFTKAGYRVIAIDPRSQGDSDKPTEGHYPERRARDYKEVVENLKVNQPVIVGWSMAVGELLEYVDQFGADGLKGVVLVDGTVALPPAFMPVFGKFLKQMQVDRKGFTDQFVRSWFARPQSPRYYSMMIDGVMKTPTNSAVALGAGAMGKMDLSPALTKLSSTPVLYVCTPQMKDQVTIVKGKLPNARVEIFEKAGHALFVDEPARFNVLLEGFMKSTQLSAK